MKLENKMSEIHLDNTQDKDIPQKGLAQKLRSAVGRHIVGSGFSTFNLLNKFPAYVAHGWGTYRKRSQLTVLAINQLPASMLAVTEILGHERKGVIDVQTFCNLNDFDTEAIEIRELFQLHGSDKASTHNYYLVYAGILSQRDSVKKIFEIGLGTNNIDVVSTMGRGGKPGASLRAFRDYCTNAEVWGADFDTRVLFEEERIKTVFVDQTKTDTFENISNDVGAEFDLMIDDGLHSPNANLNSLAFFLPRLKAGGWAVIEDISYDALEFWQIVSSVISEQYECNILDSGRDLLFAMKKLD